MKFNVIEKFVSVNGEGTRAGQLTAFVRFAGCNLRCSYCDSAYSYEEDIYEVMTEDEIVSYVDSTGVRNVTLAGGEPLCQPGIQYLVELLCRNHSVEIETNGSLPVWQLALMDPRPILTLDYKTESSGMEDENMLGNYRYLEAQDSVKFVVGNVGELEKALVICERFNLWERCNVLFSPQWGNIEPVDIVNFMKAHTLNDARLNLQIHKFIWDPDMRGV